MWLSISFDTEAAHTEQLSEALLAQGALCVTVEDAEAGTEAEKPQFDEPGSIVRPLWDKSRVIALLNNTVDVGALAEALANDLGLSMPLSYSVSAVAEENWVQLSQSQFSPIKIHERLWIVPSWHEIPNPETNNIILDPGMAFGTGSHPTTRLCLEWLCEHIQGGETVLDYGCGSGILAIAAVKLGAQCAVGVDIDEQALVVATDNAARNGIDSQTSIQFLHSDASLQDKFDRVVANILTNPLCVLAPLLIQRVRPGGYLVLSGILSTQAEQVCEVYRNASPGCALAVVKESEGWILLAGQMSL